jgi:predicted metal-dependent phosphoesterase TrpH
VLFKIVLESINTSSIQLTLKTSYIPYKLMITITTDRSVLQNRDLNFVDMHHHSTASDGLLSPQKIAQISKKTGKGICLTDHNAISGSMYLSKQKGIFTIPSIEVTTDKSKDILAYFYSAHDLEAFWTKEIKRKIVNNAVFNLHKTTIDIDTLIDCINNYNGLAALAHPFVMYPKKSYNLLSIQHFKKKIGAIEIGVSEAGYKRRINLIAQKGKPLVGGTDSHRKPTFNCLTADYSWDVDQFLESIIKKNNLIYYKKKPRTAKLLNNFQVVKANMTLRRKI